MRLTSVAANLASGVLATTAAMTGTANASHSWGGYHWARQSNPFTLKVGDNVGPAWEGYLDTFVSQWSSSSVLDGRWSGRSTLSR